MTPFTRAELEILTPIAALMAAVGAACAMPGVFLLLRRLVMVADAISHVLLFGVVTAFLLVGDPQSVWLRVGAAASGVLTVALVEALQNTRRVKADAAVALVFPALFSGGVILATLYLRNVHMDVDQVLLGSAELAATDAGESGLPRSLVWLVGLFGGWVLLVGVFYKELKLSTFDPGLAAALGFAPAAVHYALMTAVSLTTVAAFDAVGPVLVVAFFSVPPAAAVLLAERLSRVLMIAVAIGATSGVVGAAVAFRYDLNIAGTTASVLGLVFGLVYLLAPRRGLIAAGVRRWRQRRAFLETMLAIHLRRHEGTPAEPDEAAVDGLHRHLGWTPADTATVATRAARNGLVQRAGTMWKLTDDGRRRADEALRV